MKTLTTTLGILFPLLAALAVAPALAKSVHHQGQAVDLDIREICLDCHGNDTDSQKQHCAGESSHPVFIDYPPPGKEAAFVSADELKTLGILLQDGQVTCHSCHDLEDSDVRHLLVVENTRSKLCLACHIK